MMNQKEVSKKYILSGFNIEEYENVFSFAVSGEEIIAVCQKLYFDDGLQLKTITAVDEKKSFGRYRIFYVFGVPGENIFLVPYVTLKNTEEFFSITKIIHEASSYERKIWSFFGLKPIGHPNLRGALLHENWPNNIFPLRKDFDWRERPREAIGKYEFSKVEGEGIYEVPVGPVHAGIIEPGHFRFSVAGEEVLNLEAKLGYKHKGIEKLFEVFSMEERLHLAERVSGDTSFTHSMAFCQAIESLGNVRIPKRAEYLRMFFSEIERLANHFNDIGFIMLDAGYSFGGSNCARIREKIMQWNEELTGSRFLRGVNTFGGVTKNILAETSHKLKKDLEKIQKDFSQVISIAGESSSLLNRLQSTGKLDRQIAIDHGVLGVAGRGVGLEHDARIEYPYADYASVRFEMALEKSGDVYARWHVRIKEVHSSMKILKQILDKLLEKEDAEIFAKKEIALAKNSLSVGITEGWRGEIVYFVVTDEKGHISRVDVRDPSFVNWTVLGYAGRDNIIPDFPLINKSFNLSYSGNDL
jgi:Ni,Fe-hydrogenase III large subunit/Ni,Fe-hydrogenase III component G